MLRLLPGVLPVDKRIVLRFSLLLCLLSVLYSCSGQVHGEKSGGNKITVSLANARTVRDTIYGVNYWSWMRYGRPQPDLENTEAQIAALRINILRMGGWNGDKQFPEDLTTEDVDRFVSYCRSVGAQPVFQVSILGGDLDEAAGWVDYCNRQKGYEIQYWSIGNEPEFYSRRKPPDIEGYTVWDYIEDFKRYAKAMKDVDPTIKILGPEVTPVYEGSEWLDIFLQECGEMVDIVTIHRYELPANKCTINNALSGRNVLKAIREARAVIDRVCGLGKPLALTETNISWDGNPEHINEKKYPASPGTFFAGLWTADTLGIALEEDLWTISFWCLKEYWRLGLLDFKTNKPRPAYYAVHMFTNNFGSELLPVISAPKGFSVYASRRADQKTVLIVINKTKAGKGFKVSLTDGQMPIPDRPYYFPAYSITCLVIPDGEGTIDCWVYDESLAEQGRPPQYTTF
jgi:hypothetical protein